MSVTIYKRHSDTCPHKARGIYFEKCFCDYYADPRPAADRFCLFTRDRAKALGMARDFELGIDVRRNAKAAPAQAPAAPAGVTIAEAKTTFLSKLEREGIKRGTMIKHETLWRQIEAFALSAGIKTVPEFDRGTCASFMQLWMAGKKNADGTWDKKPEGARSRGKKLQRFRQFWKHAVEAEWIRRDPTTGEKIAAVKRVKAVPFEPNEMLAILAFLDGWVSAARTIECRKNRLRMKGFILLMRYSGMRIGDVVSCEIGFVRNGRVQRSAQKNGAEIDVELPKIVLDALAVTPALSERYWFWNGTSALKTRCGKWERWLKNVFDGAKIHKGKSHRFRHTFAVTMLERGESLQAVANALGDTLKVVEEYYNYWSKTRQARLDQAVRQSWTGDALLANLEKQRQGDALSRRRVN